jgi:hypothetical protein
MDLHKNRQLPPCKASKICKENSISAKDSEHHHQSRSWGLLIPDRGGCVNQAVLRVLLKANSNLHSTVKARVVNNPERIHLLNFLNPVILPAWGGL